MTVSESLITYETPTPHIARLTLNRPRKRNAQNLDLLYALDEAFNRALADDAIKVIILAAADPDFSSGHDLRSPLSDEPKEKFQGKGTWSGFSEAGAHGNWAREQEIYLQLSRRWRDLAKPTIAQVQGKCIAGGLILAWVCDLIIASDDATFCDPVVAMGVIGVEWFVHPWELGPRKAKELLFTGSVWDAAEALRLGMVNHVVPREKLAEFTLTLAEKIATRPAFALKMVKQAVNATMDIQGQRTSIDMAFQIHHLCHAHNQSVFGLYGDPAGMPALGKKTAE